MRKFRFADYKFETEFSTLPLFDQEPKVEFPDEKSAIIRSLIAEIWENQNTDEIYKAIEFLLTEAIKRKTERIKNLEKDFDSNNLWSEKMFYLICFGDHVKERNGQ